MRNAWHFYYALNLVIKAVCGGFCIACSPLSRALCLFGKSTTIDGNG
ncbi:TPA: DUF3265 domain-containing protein [Vibrio harveyi]|nr:DUF3265 domain-containing protein [Vibrio harveyi]